MATQPNDYNGGRKKPSRTSDESTYQAMDYTSKPPRISSKPGYDKAIDPHRSNSNETAAYETVDYSSMQQCHKLNAKILAWILGVVAVVLLIIIIVLAVLLGIEKDKVSTTEVPNDTTASSTCPSCPICPYIPSADTTTTNTDSPQTGDNSSTRDTNTTSHMANLTTAIATETESSLSTTTLSTTVSLGSESSSDTVTSAKTTTNGAETASTAFRTTTIVSTAYTASLTTSSQISSKTSGRTTSYTGPCQLRQTTKTPSYDQCSFNLVFILDESSWIGANNFILIKEAIKNVTSEAILTVSQSQARVGWVGFSDETWTDPSQIQLLNQAISNRQTRDATDKITYHPGQSNPVGAFNYTRDVIFVDSNGCRPVDYNHKNLLFLISNGMYTNDDFTAASTTAAELISKGIVIYAVGVGDCADDTSICNEDYLHSITGVADYTRLLEIGEYEEMGDKLAQIVKSIECPQSPPTPPVCHGDIVLVLDRSKTARAFNDVIVFLYDLFGGSGLFAVDNDVANRVALVSFAREAKIDFDLNNGNNTVDIYNYIHDHYDKYSGFPGPSNEANTARAFNTVLNNVLIPEAGDRLCSPNVIIFLSCGQYDVGEDPAIVAKSLKDQKGAVIVAFCFDGGYTDELVNITAPTGNIYTWPPHPMALVNFVMEIICVYER